MTGLGHDSNSPAAAPAFGPTLVIPAIVVAIGLLLALGQLAIGGSVLLLAAGIGAAAALVAFPEIGLMLFLAAGTFKAHVIELAHLNFDPVVLLGAIVLAGLVLRIMRRGLSAVVPSRSLVMPFLALVLVMTFSLLSHPDSLYGREKLVRFALLTGLVTLAPFGLIQTRPQFHRFLLAAVVLGLLMAMMGTVTSEGLRAFGATHIATGRILGLALLSALFLGLSIARPSAVGGRLAAAVLLAAGGILGFGFLYSGSRGGMVALVASLAVTALLAYGLKRGRRWITIGLVLVAAAGTAATFLVPEAAETMNRRVSDVLTRTDAVGSAFGRIQRAQDALELFNANPITGVGIGGFDTARGYADAVRGDYPHNILLEVGCELGVLGLGAFLFLVGLGLRTAVRSLRRVRSRRDFAVAGAVVAITAYFLVNAMFSGDLNDNRMLFAALGLCAVLPRLAEDCRGDGTR